MARTARNPDKAAARAERNLPPRDAEVLADPALHQIHVDATREILAGHEAMYAELLELVRPWPFSVESVQQPVAMWVGTADTTHPPQMTRKLAAQLPNAEVHVVPKVGTFGLVAQYPAILRFVAGETA